MRTKIYFTLHKPIEGWGWGGGRGKMCHSMLALIPQAQGVNSYSPHFTSSGAVVSGCE